MSTLNFLMEKCEIVSSRYAKNNSIERTQDWFLFKLQEELGELTKAYINAKGLGRKTNKSDAELKSELANELADVLGHALLFAKHNNIDAEEALNAKWLKYLDESNLDGCLGKTK